MDKEKIHYCAEYMLNPLHPISVDLVGCGGSGSMMLSSLARIDSALRRLGMKGLHVTAYDDDIVEESNIGRQLFTEGEIGVNKAVCLVSRFNRCYGISWEAVPEKYRFNPKTNVIISCTDNVASRKMIARGLSTGNDRRPSAGNSPEYRNYYWLDLGNAQKSGQVILGSTDIRQPKSAKYETVEHLPNVDEMYHLKKSDDRDSGPSCSLAEALSRQDLFINSTLSQMAGTLLWKILHEGVIDNHGVFVNLETMQTRPIPLP